jgi:hypothetical protein
MGTLTKKGLFSPWHFWHVSELSLFSFYNYSDSQLPAHDKWLYIDPEYPEAYSFDPEALDSPPDF